MAGRIHIGTSGWHYAHWRGPFYPEKLKPDEMLAWYAERFDTVEINNSFYRLPARSSLRAWCGETPKDFCFAVKASRYITHNCKLNDPANSFRRFHSAVRALGRRLGPILFQLPPGWKVNEGRLAEFLEALPPKRRYVFEFRNPTWNVPGVYRLLRRHHAAFCIFELAGVRSPLEITADFTYIRLHGPGKAYQGEYTRSRLQAWAKRIAGWRRELSDVFFYFDNDQSGFAAKNALQLRKFVGR
jgi:uncharacterized protein YecE (DUF72 family)